MNDPLFYHIDNGNPKTHRLKLLIDGVVKVIWELESIDLVKEKRWAELQIEGYYNFESNLMNKNSCDSAVLMARFYETIWLPDIECNVRHHEEPGV